MELINSDPELEKLNTELNDPALLEAYQQSYKEYEYHWVPKIFAWLLVGCGTLVYGRKPSYLKFRAIEIIARVPYHSWSAAAFTLLTWCFANEQKAIHFSQVARFSRIASENETMHVVVISHLAQKEGSIGRVRGGLLPMLFAFFYFWVSYWLYLLRPHWSYELNALFETHAFEQYDQFLATYEEALKKKEVDSDFLCWYGRNPIHQYDFFRSVRNDELIHRNQSLHKIGE